MARIREINNLADLSCLRAAWNALLTETPGASFFQSLDWLEVYWHHFGAGQQLRVLVVEDDQRVTGILPLVIRARRLWVGSLRVLTYPLDEWGSFYGPVGPEPAGTLRSCLQHLKAPRDWDLLELAWIDATGSDAGRTKRTLTAAGFSPLAERGQASALIELKDYNGWPAYWASRTSRWRNNVRRSEKKLAEVGSISYFRYRPAASSGGDFDPRWDLYDECERIATASWQSNSESGTTLTHAAIRPFLRECHERAARCGALDLNLLLVDGQGAAFNYAYHCQGHVFGLRTGFDAAVCRDGAGTVLQARMIEDCFARNDQSYDLGPGYGECKRYWQTEVRHAWRYTHFPAYAPWAQLARAKRGAVRWLSGQADANENGHASVAMTTKG